MLKALSTGSISSPLWGLSTHSQDWLRIQAALFWEVLAREVSFWEARSSDGLPVEWSGPLLELPHLLTRHWTPPAVAGVPAAPVLSGGGHPSPSATAAQGTQPSYCTCQPAGVGQLTPVGHVLTGWGWEAAGKVHPLLAQAADYGTFSAPSGSSSRTRPAWLSGAPGVPQQLPVLGKQTASHGLGPGVPVWPLLRRPALCL